MIVLHCVTVDNAYASTYKTKIIRIVTDFYFYFILLITEAEAPDIYVRTSMLCCFHSLSTETFANCTECADSVRITGPISADRCSETRSAPSVEQANRAEFGGRGTESDARSVGAVQTPSTGLRHPSFNHCSI